MTSERVNELESIVRKGIEEKKKRMKKTMDEQNERIRSNFRIKRG